MLTEVVLCWSWHRSPPENSTVYSNSTVPNSEPQINHFNYRKPSPMLPLLLTLSQTSHVHWSAASFFDKSINPHFKKMAQPAVSKDAEVCTLLLHPCCSLLSRSLPLRERIWPVSAQTRHERSFYTVWCAVISDQVNSTEASGLSSMCLCFFRKLYLSALLFY